MRRPLLKTFSSAGFAYALRRRYQEGMLFYHAQTFIYLQTAKPSLAKNSAPVQVRHIHHHQLILQLMYGSQPAKSYAADVMSGALRPRRTPSATNALPAHQLYRYWFAPRLATEKWLYPSPGKLAAVIIAASLAMQPKALANLYQVSRSNPLLAVPPLYRMPGASHPALLVNKAYPLTSAPVWTASHTGSHTHQVPGSEPEDKREPKNARWRKNIQLTLQVLSFGSLTKQLLSDMVNKQRQPSAKLLRSSLHQAASELLPSESALSPVLTKFPQFESALPIQNAVERLSPMSLPRLDRQNRRYIGTHATEALSNDSRLRPEAYFSSIGVNPLRNEQLNSALYRPVSHMRPIIIELPVNQASDIAVFPSHSSQIARETFVQRAYVKTLAKEAGHIKLYESVHNTPTAPAATKPAKRLNDQKYRPRLAGLTAVMMSSRLKPLPAQMDRQFNAPNSGDYQGVAQQDMLLNNGLLKTGDVGQIDQSIPALYQTINVASGQRFYPKIDYPKPHYATDSRLIPAYTNKSIAVDKALITSTVHHNAVDIQRRQLNVPEPENPSRITNEKELGELINRLPDKSLERVADRVYKLIGKRSAVERHKRGLY